MTEKKFEKAEMQGGYREGVEAAKIQAQWRGVNERVARDSDGALRQAKQVLAAEEAKRIQACAAAIQAVLAEHGCNLVPVPQLTPDGRIVALVQIRSVVEE